jgi:PIN domain nuclease of toxin-antitoxin system
MGLCAGWRALQGRPAAPPVILLDTNAVIWLEQDHPRVRSLARGSKRFYVSPASLLELQFLHESGRIRLNTALADLVAVHQWTIDDPPAAAWFEQAWAMAWTRDPFDRLLVAHARLRRWRLATADTRLLERLTESERLAL